MTDGLSMVHLVIASVVNAACEAFFEPAQMVAVRQVVPASQLPNAIAQDEARGHLAGLGVNLREASSMCRTQPWDPPDNDWMRVVFYVLA